MFYSNLHSFNLSFQMPHFTIPPLAKLKGLKMTYTSAFCRLLLLMIYLPINVCYYELKNISSFNPSF